jgi:hypothetical protein
MKKLIFGFLIHLLFLNSCKNVLNEKNSSFKEDNLIGTYVWSCATSREKIEISKNNSFKQFNKKDWDYSKINSNMNTEDLPIIWENEPMLGGDKKYRIHGNLLITSIKNPYSGIEYYDTLLIGDNTLTYKNKGTLGIDYKMECYIDRVFVKK